MSTLLPKGMTIKYISWDGMKYSKIRQAVTIDTRNIYSLENGDYVVDTPMGFVKTNETTELLKVFKSQKED